MGMCSERADLSPSHGVVPVRTRIRSAPKQLDGHTLLLFVADLLLCLIAVLLQPTLRRICRTNRYCVVTLMCTQTHGVCMLPRSDHSEWMRALRSFSLTRPTGRMCRLTRRQLGQVGALTRLGLRERLGAPLQRAINSMHRPFGSMRHVCWTAMPS